MDKLKNFNLQKIIVFSIIFMAVIWGLGFIVPHSVQAVNVCFQCKCSYDNFHDKSAAIAVDDKSGIEPENLCNNTLCGQFNGEGKIWTRRTDEKVARKPECDSNCTSSCIDSIGSGGGGGGGGGGSVSCNDISVSVSPQSVKVGEKVNFTISGNGSTFFRDDFEDGASNCSGGWTAQGGTIQCTAAKEGSFKWTHFWKNCSGSTSNCSAECSKQSTTFTVAANSANGACGTEVNTCAAGALKNTSEDTTQWRWECHGANGGTNASCSKPKPANGSCGATHYNCTTGTSGSQQELADKWTWKCTGSSGGTTADCTEMKPLTCTIAGPDSVPKNEKATYSASSTDNRVQTFEIYYNFNDKSVGSDYRKIQTCNKDITGLNGNCKGTVDAALISANKENFTVVCNAYDWKCPSDSTRPVDCKPDGKNLKANACSGNPLVTPERDFNGWSSCGSNSHKEVRVTAPSAITTHFRVAENPADLSKAAWQSYEFKDRMVDAAVFPYDFKTSGQKFIFVEFKDNSNPPKVGGCGEKKDKPCQVEIKVLGEEPKVISCSLGFDGGRTTLNLTGKAFGNVKGKVKSSDAELEIKEWKNTSVKAVINNVQEGQAIPVVLINADEQTSEEVQCSSVSQLSLGAKVFCRAPSSHDVDNAEFVLAEGFPGGKKIKQKVRINREGVIEGLNQKLEVGKEYIVSIKAPRLPRKTSARFIAGEGTTTVPNFVLAVGDIFPVDGGDGKINTLDKAELNRQFAIAVDTSGRSGDFNQDDRVNSIDWACMRHGFGKGDDPEPEAGGSPASSNAPSSSISSSSPSPSPSVSPSPSFSPSPGTNSPSPSPSFSPSPSVSGPTASCPAPGTKATLTWPAVAGASKYYLKIDNTKDPRTCRVTPKNPDDSCFPVQGTTSTINTEPGATYNWFFDVLDSNQTIISQITGPSFTCAR